LAVQQKKWTEALAQTRRTTFGRLATLFGATDITADFWDELETAFIQADMGVTLTSTLIDEMRSLVKQEGITNGDDLLERLKLRLIEQLPQTSLALASSPPTVIILVGVNGSGKTTTAAKLAHWLTVQDQRVIFAAADTYRAAAAEQLTLWAERLELEIIRGNPGSDPGAIVYDAAQAAAARKADVLIVDTSGRMHTHGNLMAELQKIVKVAGKVIPDAPHHVLLVLDATTGQNGIAQAKAFTQSVGVSGVILAKLDSSAKGGVGFAVSSQLKLPIFFAGLGESIADLSSFDARAYVNGLIDKNQSV
jgi:fused signal recognition particle receptor